MMQMREKKPERPLDWYITMFAKLFSKKPLHEFLLFETDDFMISLDFYDTNVIQLCMGDEANVLEIHTSENRAQSRVVSNVNGSLWEMAFKHGQFTVGRLLEFFNSVPSNGQWAMTSNSGTHFSGRVWHEVRNIVHK